MALRMNSHVHTPSILRRASSRLVVDDAFTLWPSLDVLERDPFVCFADDDNDDNDDKDDKGKQKTFTQEDVDRIVQRRLKKETSEREALAKQLDELKQQLEDSKVDDNGEKVSPTKKLERALERANAKIAELETKAKESETKATTQVGALKRAALERQAMAALVASGALPTATKHAMAAFLAESGAEVEFEETGARFIVTVDGTPYEDDGSGVELSKAAAKWLATNKHFAKAPDGGGGSDPKTKDPNAGPKGLDLEKASTEDLLSAGLSAPAKK